MKSFSIPDDLKVDVWLAKKLQIFNKSEIENIQRPTSGMPPANYMLTQSQVRDVVVFLGSLKDKNEKPKTSH